MKKPHQPAGCPTNPVDPDLLADPVARPSAGFTLRNPVADNHPLAGRRVVPILQQPVHQRQSPVVRLSEVDQLALVLRAKRPGDGQDVDRLNQCRLSLRVLPEVDRDPRRNLQVHFSQVPKIAQPQAGKTHLLLFPQFLFLKLPLRQNDSRTKKHNRYGVILCSSLFPSLE